MPAPAQQASALGEIGEIGEIGESRPLGKVRESWPPGPAEQAAAHPPL
jgi:hypothetical protein